MLRISLVEYLNTKPFIDGLEEEFSPNEIQITSLPPVKCAESLRKRECDLALVPVGALPELKGIEILKDYCIGASGKVNSVFLFSQVPVEQISKVILDPHSKSSNGLARILFKSYWRIPIELKKPVERDFDKIKGNVAGIAIGDKAFALKESFHYVYDLSYEWGKWTGLPFVFAVWAYYPEKIDESRRKKLIEALQKGVNQRRLSAIQHAATYGYSENEAVQYLEESIDFSFDMEKHEALKRYLVFLSELK